MFDKKRNPSSNVLKSTYKKFTNLEKKRFLNCWIYSDEAQNAYKEIVSKMSARIIDLYNQEKYKDALTVFYVLLGGRTKIDYGGAYSKNFIPCDVFYTVCKIPIRMEYEYPDTFQCYELGIKNHENMKDDQSVYYEEMKNMFEQMKILTNTKWNLITVGGEYMTDADLSVDETLYFYRNSSDVTYCWYNYRLECENVASGYWYVRNGKFWMQANGSHSSVSGSFDIARRSFIISGTNIGYDNALVLTWTGKQYGYTTKLEFVGTSK